MNHKLLAALLTSVLLALIVMPTGAAPLNATCTPGAVYNPDCDVDNDGDVDVIDIQLAAGHWNRTGTFAGGSAWQLTGNAGTVPGTNFLGTTDNQALQIKVNGTRALLIQPNSNGSHNIVGGYAQNAVTAGAVGATIGGGGTANVINLVTDGYGTVGGGVNNRAGDNDANPTNNGYATVGGGISNVAAGQSSTVAGGEYNQATAPKATIGGGSDNLASGSQSTIGGGFDNTASGTNATVGGGTLNNAGGQGATIGGGASNTTSADYATIGGGSSNSASGNNSTVGGGSSNSASGSSATVPGGNLNLASGDFSFAAGRRARAIHNGAFVWADSTDADFSSTVANNFRVRATGGSEFRADNASYGMQSDNDGTGDGIRTYASTSNGNNWAALFASNGGTSPAVYANSGGTYAGYFADQISVNGGCTGCSLMFVAVNAGGEVLQVGEVVAAAGVDNPLAGTVDPVLRIQRADANASGVVGVVHRLVTITRGTKDGEVLDSAQAATGAVQPGDHLLVVVQGLAQVRVADGQSITAGQRLTVADTGGRARVLRDVEPRGFNTPVLGMALGAPDAASGLAPVMVALR